MGCVWEWFRKLANMRDMHACCTASSAQARRGQCGRTTKPERAAQYNASLHHGCKLRAIDLYWATAPISSELGRSRADAGTRAVRPGRWWNLVPKMLDAVL